jgi:hypothetical protein
MKRSRKIDVVAKDIKTFSPSWYKTFSAHVNPSLKFTKGEFGIGGIAIADIPSGSTLMSLPQSSILSEAYAKNTPRGLFALKLLSKKRPIECTGRALLYLEMIYQRFDTTRDTTDCIFREYLQSLPSSYDDPSWWKESEIKELLSGTNLMEGAMLRRAWLRRIYSLLVPELINANEIMFKKEIFTYDNFLWAHSAFSSRGFPDILSRKPKDDNNNDRLIIKKKVTIKENDTMISIPPIGFEDAKGINPFQHPSDEPVGCMLPVLDLLNHVPRTPIAWIRSNENVSFVYEGIKPLSTYEPVNNNYGPKSNEELLMGFGFTLPDNIDDTYTLAIRPIIAPSKPMSKATKEEKIAYKESFTSYNLFTKLELPIRYILRVYKKIGEEQEFVIPQELYHLARFDSLCNLQKEALLSETKEEIIKILSSQISFSVEERAIDFLDRLLTSKKNGLVQAQPWLVEEEKENEEEEEEKKEKEDKEETDKLSYIKTDISSSTSLDSTLQSHDQFKHRRFLARSYIRGQYRLLIKSLHELERLQDVFYSSKKKSYLLHKGNESIVCCAREKSNGSSGESTQGKFIIPLIRSKKMEFITCDECLQYNEEEGKEEEPEEESEPRQKKQRL